MTPASCVGDPACLLWNACEDWSFGVGAPGTQERVYRHQVTTCRDRGCFNACDEEAAAIQADQDTLRGTVPPEYQDRVIITERIEQVVSSRRYSPGLFEDDKFDEIRECTVTFQSPTPAAGQGAACGCATLECRSPRCGAEANEVISPAGLAFEAILALDPYVADLPAPVCSSCEPLDAPAAPDPS